MSKARSMLIFNAINCIFIMVAQFLLFEEPNKAVLFTSIIIPTHMFCMLYIYSTVKE